MEFEKPPNKPVFKKRELKEQDEPKEELKDYEKTPERFVRSHQKFSSKHTPQSTFTTRCTFEDKSLVRQLISKKPTEEQETLFGVAIDMLESIRNTILHHFTLTFRGLKKLSEMQRRKSLTIEENDEYERARKEELNDTIMNIKLFQEKVDDLAHTGPYNLSLASSGTIAPIVHAHEVRNQLFEKINENCKQIAMEIKLFANMNLESDNYEVAHYLAKKIKRALDENFELLKDYHTGQISIENQTKLDLSSKLRHGEFNRRGKGDVTDSRTSTRVSSSNPSKSKTNLLNLAKSAMKRRQPEGGFGIESTLPTKRRKYSEDQTPGYVHKMMVSTPDRPSIKPPYPTRVNSDTEECIESSSLPSVFKRSKIYNCLMMGLKTVKAATFYFLCNAAYYTWSA